MTAVRHVGFSETWFPTYALPISSIVVPNLVQKLCSKNQIQNGCHRPLELSSSEYFEHRPYTADFQLLISTSHKIAYQYLNSRRPRHLEMIINWYFEHNVVSQLLISTSVQNCMPIEAYLNPRLTFSQTRRQTQINLIGQEDSLGHLSAILELLCRRVAQNVKPLW